jgi:hypothetical protein
MVIWRMASPFFFFISSFFFCVALAHCGGREEYSGSVSPVIGLDEALLGPPCPDGLQRSCPTGLTCYDYTGYVPRIAERYYCVKGSICGPPHCVEECGFVPTEPPQLVRCELAKDGGSALDRDR